MDSKPRGYLCMILHAHLPFVRHPEHEDTLQERWLFQAMTESYIPILAALSRLSLEGTPFRITFSLSPPLLEMLHDDLLIGRYKRYLLNLLDLCDKEVERLRNVPRMSDLAVMYRSRLEEILRLFLEEFDEDLPAAWRRLRRQGAVELMTTSATHAYLPLLLHEKAVAAQIKVGIRCFRERVGVEPDGFWLPECAYSPEIEDPRRSRSEILYIGDARSPVRVSPAYLWISRSDKDSFRTLCLWQRPSAATRCGALMKVTPATGPIVNSIAISAMTSLLIISARRSPTAYAGRQASNTTG